jgi:hypothetical protein
MPIYGPLHFGLNPAEDSTRDDDRELTICFIEMSTSDRMPLELAGIEVMVDATLS